MGSEKMLIDEFRKLLKRSSCKEKNKFEEYFQALLSDILSFEPKNVKFGITKFNSILFDFNVKKLEVHIERFVNDGDTIFIIDDVINDRLVDVGSGKPEYVIKEINKILGAYG